MDAGLDALLAAIAVLRVGELLHAHQTARLLRERGARLERKDGMGLIVAVHASWFMACVADDSLHGTSLGWWTAAGAVAFAAGLVFRYWSMATLGWRWNTRVYVLPDAPLVTTGPYRFLRHPIYVGVTLELIGLPAAFGLWRTVLVIAALNGAALWRRVRLEERALGVRA